MWQMKFPGLLLASATLWTAVSGRNHEVTVGKGGQLKFEPENLAAKPGDTITYRFFAKNHAVAQSTFDSPCQYKDHGIFSGFTPTDSDSEPAPTTFTITVNNTDPLWFYCPQTNGDHCQKGMVHSVNAEGNTLEAYREKASKASRSSEREDKLPFGGLRAVHVDVGSDGLVFAPSDIQALPGTVVQFSFNPKNHTVTQSSFEKPCEQLENGFSSGFIPTNASSSGVVFHLVVKDIKPIWFYCAQPTGDHCQKGMVGSINAPSEGNTFVAFKDLATKANKPSTIAPDAPKGGIISVNGTIISDFGGNELKIKPWGDEYLKYIPKHGEFDPYMIGWAGGGAIQEYGWADKITDEAVQFLQLLNWFDNILLSLLMTGYEQLTTGKWMNDYPASIVHAVGSMTAQSYMLRTAATDSLQNYKKEVVDVCQYKMELPTIESFFDTVITVTLLEIGLLLDIVAKVAETDRWLVPCVASSLGAKSRMSGVLNLMKNHVAAAAPREPALPAPFVYSYAHSRFVGSCPAEIDGWKFKPLPKLSIEEQHVLLGTGRIVSVKVKYEEEKREGKRWVAYIGAWGTVKFSLLSEDNIADVPMDLWGHTWIVITNEKDVKLDKLYEASIAGPELLWVSQP
ncbi:extracellular serine-rich protein [Paramyrothecium foliicola]|nr:extracellular serine-rich protein [Paramyrothecium foliicola]